MEAVWILRKTECLKVAQVVPKAAATVGNGRWQWSFLLCALCHVPHPEHQGMSQSWEPSSAQLAPPGGSLLFA